MSTLNESWSAAPAPASGHAAAAPPLQRQHPTGAPKFTIDGFTSEQLRAQAQERAQRQAQAQQQAQQPPGSQAYAVIDDAAKKLRAHLEGLAAQRDQLTPAGIEAKIAEFASGPTVKAVDEAAAQMRRLRDNAAANVEQIRSALVQQGDAAQESRNTRTWQRAQRVLDNADDGRVGVVARQLLSSADRSELGVLVQELPSYLEAKGHESGWLPKALERVVPELAEAQRAARDVERQYHVIAYDVSALRESISKGVVLRHLVDPANISDPTRNGE